jgi:hypothetical protein
MRLDVACLISILAFAKSHLEEVEMGNRNRFLADRAVTMSELATHSTYAAGLWTSLGGGLVYDIPISVLQVARLSYGQEEWRAIRFT